MKDQHHEIKITITNDDDDNSIGNKSDDPTISTPVLADKGTSSRKSSILELNLISSFLKQAYYEKGIL